MINQTVTIQTTSTWSSPEEAIEEFVSLTNNLPIISFIENQKELGNVSVTVEFNGSNTVVFKRLWMDTAYNEYLTYEKGTDILIANGMTVTDILE